jgi:DNA mismatch repair protein MutS2
VFCARSKPSWPRRRKPAGGEETVPEEPVRRKPQTGDMVKIPYLGQIGVVVALEDERGRMVVMIRRSRVEVAAKRVQLFIERDRLYPDNYDMDIVFETKENRKKKRLMSRKHVEGLVIERED